MRRRNELGELIDLGDGTHSYARVMEQGIFAFYDVRTDKELKAEDILFREVLFRIGVMDYAVTSGHWPVVGHGTPMTLRRGPWRARGGLSAMN